MGGHLANFFTEKVDADGHVIGEEAGPIKARSKWGKVKAVAKEWIAPVNMASDIREYAVSQAIAHEVELLGATPRRAMAFAKQRLGNYDRTSPMGRLAKPIMFFAKWPIEGVLTLIARTAEDPVTGKSSWRGFEWNPASKALFFGAATMAWNLYMIETTGTPEEKARLLRDGNRLESAVKMGSRLPQKHSGWLGTHVMTPWFDDNGKRIMWGINSFASLADGFITPIYEAARGNYGTALSESVESLAGKLHPYLKVIPEAATGQKIGQRSPIVTEAERNMGPARQAFLNAQN